jgi:hypothetical protein
MKNYLKRSAAMFVACVLAVLLAFSMSSVAQSVKSSAKAKKKTVSGKNRAATKKTSRQRKKRLANQDGEIQISGVTSAKPDSFTKDLRTLPQIGPPASEKDVDEEEMEALPPPAKEKKPLPGAIQPPYARAEQPLSPMTPSPSVNFAGLDYTNWGTGFPPDTVGDVGRNHYIQAVNSSFAVYSKTGSLLSAVTFNNFWAGAGAGTPCANSHRGDPLVLYEQRFNGRWIVADFAFVGNGTSPPYYECIAVSKTNDPVSGGWWMYAIRADDATHPWIHDYPKMGLWRDALYMTANMLNFPFFQEARVWAFRIADLMNGLPVATVVIDLNSTAHFMLLPGNYHGVLPPSNREEFIIGESTTAFAYNIFKFKPDFVTPGNSTFTGPTAVSQASYPAPASLNPSPVNTLDTVAGDNLKMQAQYRKIGNKESLWVSHTARTSTATPNGVMWAQIDVSGGTINTTPLQQQIYENLSGDGLSRWMSSLAVDRQGNMLLGYSASSLTSNPSIRYNGRRYDDAPNTLPQGEVVMQAGGGTLAGECGGSTCRRWGDYSAMTVDPVDQCTFWYTTLYYTANQLPWNTRIGAIKFPGCTKPPFDLRGSGLTTLSIFRPSSGQWWVLLPDGTSNVTTLGTSTDKITPADFTGDSVDDVAVFRPSDGSWYVVRSEDDSFYSFPFGASGDVPVPGDYNHDGIADAAVFRPSNSTWYISLSNGGTVIQQFGIAGDKPVPADYDGDGTTDIAIFRPSSATWWLSRSSLGVIAFQFGNSTDKLVQGDYTGDGKADVALFRPPTGEWFVLRSENQSYYSAPYGTSGDVPSPGDYDGDGKFDFAVFRPSSSTWFIQKSTNGSSLIQQFGNAGDIPVPSAFVD